MWNIRICGNSRGPRLSERRRLFYQRLEWFVRIRLRPLCQSSLSIPFPFGFIGFGLVGAGTKALSIEHWCYVSGAHSDWPPLHLSACGAYITLHYISSLPLLITAYYCFWFPTGNENNICSFEKSPDRSCRPEGWFIKFYSLTLRINHFKFHKLLLVGCI